MTLPSERVGRQQPVSPGTPPNEATGDAGARAGTIACVVAHDRAHLLGDVLSALTSQLAPQDVLVVDNASTDATPDVVAAFPGVRYFPTGANLGGAGGFAWALELAMALGYRRAYLLDDDAVPQPGAIDALERAAVDLIDAKGFAFLVSEPVADRTDHEPVGMPVPAKSWRDHKTAERAGGIAVDYAAFLGIMIDLRLAKRTALPFPEFFIWCDDVEYTRRIAVGRGAACLPASAIQHVSVQMEAANRRASLGWKYFYLVRNRLWLARWGLPKADRGHRIASVLIALHATRNELVALRGRRGVVRTTLRAWRQGLLQPRPAPHAVGTLLAANPVAREWLSRQVSSVS